MKEKKINYFVLFVFWVYLSSALFLHAGDEKLSPSMGTFNSSGVEDPIQIDLIAEEEAIQPGRPFWVAIHFQLEKGWHAYWKNPGDAGMTSAIDWVLPKGFTASATQWPYPQKFNQDSMITFGYEDEVWLLTRITPPATLDQNTPVKIGADIDWLVCSDTTCLPGIKAVSMQIPVTSSKPRLRKEWESAFSQAREKLPKKQWNLKAYRSNGLIELRLQAPVHHLTTYTAAEFFPEHKGIDVKGSATLLTKENRPGAYVLALKEDDSDEKTPFLRGVVVLQNDASLTEAIDINLPLVDRSQEEEISFADSKNEPAIKSPQLDVQITQTSAEDQIGFVWALLFAFIGGMILNLMPCVLPVMSVKVLSFVKLASENRSTTLKHGAAFTFGVLLSFWVLAGLLLILQAYGNSVGWGFQLQEPLFVAALAALLLIFSLSLFGVFEIGASVTAYAGQANMRQKTGLIASFLSGVLATAVATPCTGPFLGTAIGFAVTLSPLPALLIFTSLGLGMAFPYLLLAAFPRLLRFMPKPGAWMETFKEVMGFLMLATVLWLIWVFGAQTNTLGVALLLAGFFFLSIGCWILGKWGTPIQSKTVRAIGYLFAALWFGAGSYIIVNSTAAWVIAYDVPQANQTVTADAWEPFSAERVADLQKKGIPVFVDFTAKWCLICQANHLVLVSDAVATKFDALGVVRMKADWTRKDGKITEALRQFGRNGVPLYVLYGANSETAAILPQVLTPENVLEHLNKLERQIAESKR